MKELSCLKKLGNVKAPYDFERKTISQLSLRKREKLHIRRLRFSFGGAISVMAVIILIVVIFFIPQRKTVKLSLKEEDTTNLQRSRQPFLERIIPVIEPVNYSMEAQTFANEPKTIYILEQISRSSNESIIY